MASPWRDLCTQDQGQNQTQSSAGQEPILGKQTFGEEKTEPPHLHILTRKAMTHSDVNVLQTQSTPNCKRFLLNSKGYPHNSCSLTDMPVCSQGRQRARVHVQLTHQKLCTALENTCRRLVPLSWQCLTKIRKKILRLWLPPTPQYVHLLSWLNLPGFSAGLATLLSAPGVSVGDPPPLECLLPFQRSLPLLRSPYRSHLLMKAFSGHQTDPTPALTSRVLFHSS